MMARAVLEQLTDSVYSLSFSLLLNEKRSTMISYFIHRILSSVRAGYVYLYFCVK